MLDRDSHHNAEPTMVELRFFWYMVCQYELS